MASQGYNELHSAHRGQGLFQQLNKAFNGIDDKIDDTHHDGNIVDDPRQLRLCIDVFDARYSLHDTSL